MKPFSTLSLNALLSILVLTTTQLTCNAKEFKHNYSISCGSEKTGTVAVTEQICGENTTIASLSSLDLGKLGEPYIFIGKSQATWNQDTLTSFDHWLIEKEERWHLSGKRLGSELLVAAAKIKSRDQREVEELSGLAGTIASYTIPHAGAALQLLGLFFGEETEGEGAVPLNYYDTTDFGLYRFLFNLPPWKGKKKIRLFNTQTMELEKATIMLLGKKTFDLENVPFLCTGFELNSKQSQSTLWLNDRPQLMPLLIKKITSEDALHCTITYQPGKDQL